MGPYGPQPGPTLMGPYGPQLNEAAEIHMKNIFFAALVNLFVRFCVSGFGVVGVGLTLPRSSEIIRYSIKKSRLDPKREIFDENVNVNSTYYYAVNDRKARTVPQVNSKGEIIYDTYENVKRSTRMNLERDKKDVRRLSRMAQRKVEAQHRGEVKPDENVHDVIKKKIKHADTESPLPMFSNITDKLNLEISSFINELKSA